MDRILPDKNDPFKLRPVWNAILDVYVEYAKICERYGLRYSLAYGNVIGAVRDKGFIPWDDDLDVIMPRDDYERFVEIAQKELPSHLRWIDHHTREDYPWLFGKVQDVRRDVIERVEAESGYCQPQGIYVDVFPLDGYPDGLFARARRILSDWCFLAWYVNRTISTFAKERAARTHYRVLSMVGMFLRPFYPKVSTLSGYTRYNESRIRKYQFGDTQYCTGATTYLCLGLSKPKFVTADMKETLVVPFETISVPIPSGYDSFLRAHYGDYMTPPPREKQALYHGAQEEARWKFG